MLSALDMTRERFNPKRKMAASGDVESLQRLADTIGYTGNPEHKRNPGDFNLTPPSCPRPTKTLCDAVGIFTRAEALRILRQGVRRGFISVQTRGGFPQNIWAVTDGGEPLEAQLDQRASGSYHGYPMPNNDPFRKQVLARWNA